MSLSLCYEKCDGHEIPQLYKGKEKKAPKFFCRILVEFQLDQCQYHFRQDVSGWPV